MQRCGRRVLVTSNPFWQNGREAVRALEAAGFTVAYVDPGKGHQPGPHWRDCDAVIAGPAHRYDAPLFRACPRLKAISCYGLCLDSVEVPAATEAGVIVTHTPAALAAPTADYAFALLLALARRVIDAEALTRADQPLTTPGVLLSGKTLGLAGFGRIGQAVARRAGGFDMRVVAYDPYFSPTDSPAPLWGLPRVSLVALEDLASQSDFVSAHLPWGPDTERMFDAGWFGRMKPTAYFVNVSRRSLVDEDALAAALHSGRIAGAALDVGHWERLPPDHPLRQAPRCVLTCNNVRNVAELGAAMSLEAAQNILSLFSGQRPASVCNPEVWDSPALRIRR